ncbi:hypothetical protein Pelo_7744 [Pelomyxa schiedti]|nr:hypothetical protein Pelo_7744 [Pelomyxa schiedti]
MPATPKDGEGEEYEEEAIGALEARLWARGAFSRIYLRCCATRATPTTRAALCHGCARVASCYSRCCRGESCCRSGDCEIGTCDCNYSCCSGSCGCDCDGDDWGGEQVGAEWARLKEDMDRESGSLRGAFGRSPCPNAGGPSAPVYISGNRSGKAFLHKQVLRKQYLESSNTLGPILMQMKEVLRRANSFPIWARGVEFPRTCLLCCTKDKEANDFLNRLKTEAVNQTKNRRSLQNVMSLEAVFPDELQVQCKAVATSVQRLFISKMAELKSATEVSGKMESVCMLAQDIHKFAKQVISSILEEGFVHTSFTEAGEYLLHRMRTLEANSSQARKLQDLNSDLVTVCDALEILTATCDLQWPEEFDVSSVKKMRYKLLGDLEATLKGKQHIIQHKIGIFGWKAFEKVHQDFCVIRETGKTISEVRSHLQVTLKFLGDNLALTCSTLAKITSDLSKHHVKILPS